MTQVFERILQEKKPLVLAFSLISGLMTAIVGHNLSNQRLAAYDQLQDDYRNASAVILNKVLYPQSQTILYEATERSQRLVVQARGECSTVMGTDDRSSCLRGEAKRLNERAMLYAREQAGVAQENKFLLTPLLFAFGCLAGAAGGIAAGAVSMLRRQGDKANSRRSDKPLSFERTGF